MKLLAPGKINLSLRVGKVRSDGFHPLVSWFCTIGLYDEIRVEPGEGFGLSMTCSTPELPADERNLLYRAGKRIGFAGKIHLEKRIPMGAGLGGGSSDAGRLLLAARGALVAGRAEKIAGELGSDVMFFVTGGGSAICRGKGEIVEPVARPTRARWAVVAMPGIHVSTAQVYGRFDEMGLGSELREEDWAGWGKLAAAELMEKLVNDLEAPAFSVSQELREIHGRLEQQWQRRVRMSGSGSSLFTLVESKEEGEDLARRSGGMEMAVVEVGGASADNLATGE